MGRKDLKTTRYSNISCPCHEGFIIPTYKIDEKEFKERCAYKKEILKNIWK